MSDNRYKNRYENGEESSIGFGRFWDWTKRSAADSADWIGDQYGRASRSTQEAASEARAWRYEKLGEEGAGGATNKVLDFIEMVFGKIAGGVELGAKGIGGFIQNMSGRAEISAENYQAEQENSAPTTRYEEPVTPAPTPNVRDPENDRGYTI
jgi:hypothetical protein